MIPRQYLRNTHLKAVGCALLAAMLLIPGGPALSRTDGPVLRGYISHVPPESPAEREARHKEMAEKRKETVVDVHRGATAFAPENTLEAYAAAMDYGADGCEIDLRKTADGVLVCLHDYWVSRTNDGWGTVGERSYYDLLKLRMHTYGSATGKTKLPTFAAVLALARQRRMFLELDIKDEGINDDIARALDEADAWDHVVDVSAWNSDKIRKNPKLKLLPGRGYLVDGRKDMDPEFLKKLFPCPGGFVTVEDPRLAAKVLNRTAYIPVPLPKWLYQDWKPNETAPKLAEGKLFQTQYLNSLAGKIDPNSQSQLETLLSARPMDRLQVDGSESYKLHRRERILARAWAAKRLGQVGTKSPRLVKLLEDQVKNRSLDTESHYNGMDGACAIGALVELGSVESVPVLIDAFRRTDPELARVVPAEYKDAPLRAFDWMMQFSVVEAMGKLRCQTSKGFLCDYLAMSESEASKLGPTWFEDAAVSLLNHQLASSDLKLLLTHPDSAVRGLSIQHCLDHPTTESLEALKAYAPWALDLPRVSK